MLYLASASPRRAELLRQIGIQFNTVVADIDETAQPGESAQALALRLSREKALKAQAMLAKPRSEHWILAADTLISVDDQILGKPQSQAECQSMLRQLSGRSHDVISAIALSQPDGGELSQALCRSEVRFRSLTDSEIADYCASSEPMDKAGSYAIQGRAAMFIENLNGSYSAVMGLPLFETAQLLQQSGYPIA